jgi:hypothetical protein
MQIFRTTSSAAVLDRRAEKAFPAQSAAVEMAQAAESAARQLAAESRRWEEAVERSPAAVSTV